MTLSIPVAAALLSTRLAVAFAGPPDPDIVDDPSAPKGVEREGDGGTASPDPTAAAPSDPPSDPPPAPEGPSADSGTSPQPTATPANESLPRPARRRGVGLLVSAGVVGGLGLLSSIGRVGSMAPCANALGETTDTAEVDELLTNGFTAAGKCLRFAAADTGLGALQIALNGTAFGLAAGGGAVHGRAIAIDDIRSGRERKRAPLAAVGGVLLGVGVIGYISLRVISIGTFWGIRTGCREIYGEELATCMKTQYTGRMVGYEAFQASGIIGVAMLADGARYMTTRRHWREGREARLSPMLGVDRVGASFTMRF